MDLSALRHGNFHQLGEAITDWRNMTKHLKTLAEDADKNLKGKARKANWAGMNATVTREFIDKTAGEFYDAHTQADTVTKILSDTRGELIDCRAQVNDAIERGLKKNLTVMDMGDGSFVVTRSTRPDWASDPGGQKDTTCQKDADDLRDEIQRILDKATESDNSAAKVLKLLVDQVKHGFSDASYADRDQAANALKAAERMAKLAEHPEDMSPKELTAFNRTLKKYRDDDLFAERFATSLGGKNTLQFWKDITDLHAGARGKELDELKDLQKNLSMTLATATYSDSSKMDQWKQDVIGEGTTSIRTKPSQPFQTSTGSLGFQVMSSLMRDGKYDTEFLNDYKKELLKADEGPAGEGKNTDEYWKGGRQNADLVFGKGDGTDAVIGFMDALTQNPEAAERTFETQSDLNHLLQSTKYTDRGEYLGHALEVAVTGVKYGDTPDEPLPHSDKQVSIMQNVMHAVADPAGGASLVKEGIGESFGNMAAAYMPEIGLSLAGPGAETIFPTNSAAPYGLDKTDATRFLYEVARDPAGNASILYGESIYTSSALEAHIADPSIFDGTTNDAILAVTKNSGLIQGILAHSRADMDISDSVQQQEDYNDALKQKGDYFKTLLSTGVGVGSVALVPATPAGALVGAVAGGFFGGVSGMAVDRILEGQELDGALDEALYRNGQDLNSSEDSAKQQNQWSALDAINKHHSDLKPGATENLIRDAVGDGWRDSDSLLEDVHSRPSA
ncbi:hypothetical protein ABZS98_21365 [Streptomyces avermitilis]|uniref:hypothetical protein n=1 Tax=Streptomyces avermitilis TaxID=33903 RepID=UPI0033A91CB4